jgi:hypothetical protein
MVLVAPSEGLKWQRQEGPQCRPSTALAGPTKRAHRGPAGGGRAPDADVQAVVAGFMPMGTLAVVR